jgi:hypothetical protein
LRKLLKLKEWLTVPDAARHLSILFGEEVSEADVLRLALDGHLTLSVFFVNHAKARCGRTVRLKDAKVCKLIMPDTKEEVLYIPGPRISEEEVLELGGSVESIRGVWDLTMLGAERLDVEHEYQMLTSGPAVDLVFLDGPIVSREDGSMCQLQDRFENSDKKQVNNPDNYHPAGTLPLDSVLVIRTLALRKLEARISDLDKAPEKPIERRERMTLLVMIAALAKLAKINVAKPSSAAAAIESQTALMGARIAARTIENHLGRISEAFDNRGEG